MSTTARYAELREHLASLGSVLVAFSGGVDSTLLARAASEALGPHALLALAISDVLAPSEIEEARAVATFLGMDLVEVGVDPLADPEFAANPPERCYICKRGILSALRRLADERGLAHIVDGSNADDLADHRPGRAALIEFGVASPLLDAGLGKDEIRELSRELGLPTADKPSLACLASRFPYGERIDRDGLARVARAEGALKDLGLRQLRVRSHGDVARIEVEPAELEAAFAMRTRIADAVRGAGFRYVALDLQGYRTGSLNEVLEP